MVDERLVLRKIALLEEYMTQIREFSQITVNEYSNDWKTQQDEPESD